jgi:hypothetical protein
MVFNEQYPDCITRGRHWIYMHTLGVKTVTYMTMRFKLDDSLEPRAVRDAHVIKLSTLL